MIKKITFIILLVFHFLEGYSELPLKMNGNEICFLRSVQIEGKTNLSTFYLSYQNTRPVNKSLNSVKMLTSSKSLIIEFKIPIDQIKGKNKKIQNDFRELLISSKYKDIVVGINKEEFLGIISYKIQNYLSVNLTLSDTSKDIKVAYSIHEKVSDGISLQGITEVKLSDFGLVPPKKFLGLVRVQDVIFITFDILINEPNLSNQADIN